jgi:hypothetical protein
VYIRTSGRSTALLKNAQSDPDNDRQSQGYPRTSHPHQRCATATQTTSATNQRGSSCKFFTSTKSCPVRSHQDCNHAARIFGTALLEGLERHPGADVSLTLNERQNTSSVMAGSSVGPREIASVSFGLRQKETTAHLIRPGWRVIGIRSNTSARPRTSSACDEHEHWCGCSRLACCTNC